MSARTAADTDAWPRCSLTTIEVATVDAVSGIRTTPNGVPRRSQRLPRPDPAAQLAGQREAGARRPPPFSRSAVVVTPAIGADRARLPDRAAGRDDSSAGFSATEVVCGVLGA